MNHIRKILLWLPAVLWYRVIWNFSAQSAGVSGDLSDRLLWRLLALLSPAFSARDMAARNAAVELLSFFERKAAHMVLYFVLIRLLWLALAPLLLALLVGWSVRRWRVGATSLSARLPVLAGALLLLCAAFLPVSFSRLPWFLWAARRFAPGFSALSAAGQDALLDALDPMLREVCFLILCGLTGCCGALSAALAGPPVRTALLRACLWSLVPACALALFLAPALVPAAGLLALLGCLLLGVVQLTAGFLKQSAKR